MNKTPRVTRDQARRITERFRVRAMRTMLAILLERGRATVDDIHDRLTVPACVDARVLGGMLREIEQAHITTAEPWVNSRRRESHARPVRIWRLVSPAKADAWLLEFPEPEPDPDLDALEACRPRPMAPRDNQRSLPGMEADR